MPDPSIDFWAMAVTCIGFAAIVQCSNSKKNLTSDNQKLVVWAIALILVYSEYRVSTIKQAFLDAAPAAYHLWDEIQRGPDTD